LGGGTQCILLFITDSHILELIVKPLFCMLDFNMFYCTTIFDMTVKVLKLFIDLLMHSVLRIHY